MKSYYINLKAIYRNNFKMLPIIFSSIVYMISEVHRATFGGHEGYYNPRTGRVRFGKQVYPSIEVAVKYLKKK